MNSPRLNDWDLLGARLTVCAAVAGISPDQWEYFLERVQELNDHDLNEASPFPLSPPAEATIIAMVHLVAICDFYDAITTREGPNRGRVAETMREYFPDSDDRIDWLLEH